MSAPEQPDRSKQDHEHEESEGQVSELAMEGTDPKEVSPEEPAVGQPAEDTGGPR